MGAKLRILAVLALELQLIISATCADNIDTREPILRRPPAADVQDFSYFGYTLVLHQVEAVTPRDRDEALMNTRIVVSAPNRTTVGAQVKRTGALFICPITQGECQRLAGTGTNGDKLYDTGDNENNEDKKGQFLGGSMASSSDGRFIVCAHRYAYTSGPEGYPIGRCYSTKTRNLLTANFDVLDPCPGPGDDYDLDSAGVCQAGTSSVFTNDAIGLGSPGYFDWRGIVIRLDDNGNKDYQAMGSGDTRNFRNTYQGYSLITGNFLSRGTEDFAASVPRLNNYFGQVNIVSNDRSLTVASQPNLRGSQMGEYYGFSLLSADLNGDGLDELLVGAPMYRANSTQPETGRVYIYNNIAGNLQLLRQIEGFEAYSRFGYAMANLGDINGDRGDDVAISAPFSTVNDSGTVYIYHSSRLQTLTTTPQQRIIGSELSISSDLSSLRGFGSALASGVDVDGNTYNDLAIGTFMSQEVFLLRTRPLAQVTARITANPQIVDLDNLTCTFQGNPVACFDVEACASYTGTGLSDNLDFQYNITADVDSLEKRIVFMESSSPTVVPDVMVDINQEHCQTFRVYVQNSITDRLNPFILQFNVQVPEMSIPQGDGNPSSLTDFSTFPIVSSSGISRVQVETFKNCSEGVCTPDLKFISPAAYRAILVDGSERSSNIITVDGVRSMVIDTTVMNGGEDAFQATITVTVPSRQLEIRRLTGTLNSGSSISLVCPQREEVTESDVDLARVTCSIGNPLAGGARIVISTTIIPRIGLVGNEGNINVNFRVSSVNPEGESTRMDNEFTGLLMVNAIADVTLDSPALVSPELLSYSNNPPNGTITNVTQLGPGFMTSFVVRNSGPSTVRTISLVINWPIGSTESNDFFYLYPAQYTPGESGAAVTCNNTNINPEGYILDNSQSASDQEGQSMSSTQGGKRRRRSAVPISRTKRVLKKRQDAGTDPEVMISTNRTLSCSSNAAVINCVRIYCTITGLQGRVNSEATVNIIGYIDERFFAMSNDRFSIIPTAEVSIVDETIIQQNENQGKTASAVVRVIPAGVSGGGGAVEDSGDLPWWVIVLAVVGAIIILAIIFVLLWVFGFFRRRKHEELKQRKEELQNLENNGTSPGDDGTNL